MANERPWRFGFVSVTESAPTSDRCVSVQRVI